MYKATSNEYLSNGLIIEPNNPHTNDRVTIIYNGILAQNGATQIFAHVGFGEDWQNTTEYEMHKTTSGFEANITAPNAETINAAFRDEYYNWDNNSSMDYYFNVQRYSSMVMPES